MQSQWSSGTVPLLFTVQTLHVYLGCYPYWVQESASSFEGSVCMFEVIATPVSRVCVVIFLLSGQNWVLLCEWQSCSSSVCFQNRQGESVQLKPGILPHPSCFSLTKYFLLLPHFSQVLFLENNRLKSNFECFCYLFGQNSSRNSTFCPEVC